MRKLLVDIPNRNKRIPRVPDARITIADSIVMIEYSNGMDMMIEKSDPRAIQIVDRVKLII